MATHIDWTREEVEAIVADYFHMLTLELAGQQYSKAAHRSALKAKLNQRSDGSIEFKHQNISAVMIESGCPYIRGYKPAGNYQALLFKVVSDRVASDRAFEQSASAAAELPAVAPLQLGFDELLMEAPISSVVGVQEPKVTYSAGAAVGVKRDYLAREARNRSLGSAGETFVVAYERHRLYAAGKKKLSENVEHVALSKGDGLGYDILSFEESGRERFIEVKTTAFGRDTPFYLSRTELAASKQLDQQFQLYRLFDFRRQPRMFSLVGAVDRHCALDSVSYLARYL